MIRAKTPDPQAWGVDSGYRDYTEVWHDAPSETVDSLLRAMNANTELPPASLEGDPVLVVTPATNGHVEGNWQIRSEDGRELRGSGPLPSDLPLGYHVLSHDKATDVLLISAPDGCPSADGMRSWGWALQLYGLRSKKSWGMGDLRDLGDFAKLAIANDAQFLLLNPLHAPLPGLPQQPSPYFPSSREYRNPLFLNVEDVPGAHEHVVDLEEIAHQARALNGDRRIDRDAVWRLKADALERIWRHSSSALLRDGEFKNYRIKQDLALERYAIFCALTEVHGTLWQGWPEDLRHPGNAAVSAFAQHHEDRVQFHMWLQWQIDRQLRAAAEGIDLVQDLAIGVDPSGADAWLWQDALALGVRVGAPPDEFNRAGQDWGFPPFDPWRLRSLQYEPFIRTVRACMEYGAGLRIDHVMGLFRLFWIPEGSEPSAGTYVRYRWDEMLAIVALESHRAGAHVVGEDLGTVEPYMREELSRRNILSYRLLWFEEDHPSKFPEGAMAAITTHDLPTIAGLWTGSDLQYQHQLGLDPNDDSTNRIQTRVEKWLDLQDGAPVEDVVTSAHRMLATAPSAMVTATVDDALGVLERPNYPGTDGSHPNWSLALPVALEDLAGDSGFCSSAQALQQGRRISRLSAKREEPFGTVTLGSSSMSDDQEREPK